MILSMIPFDYSPKKLSLILFGAFSILVIIYSFFIEPEILTVSDYEVTLPTKQSLTMVAISDLHVGPYHGERFTQRVVDRINALQPDFIFLLGDFTTHGEDPDEYLLPFQALNATYGIFAVLGNHEYSCTYGNVFQATHTIGFDHAQRVQRFLERVGITVLRNESREVMVNDELFHIAGTDDSCSGRGDIKAALSSIERDGTMILLSHSPDVILDNNAKYPHLILAGHTHGGRIRLPFIGPLTSLQRFTYILDSRRDSL